jgi:hypothetical protein
MDQNQRDYMMLLQLRATQQLVGQSYQQAAFKGMPCPYCGGDAVPNYERCKNCASLLSWVEGHPCKPGDEDRFAQALAEQRKKQANFAALQKKRDASYNAKLTVAAVLAPILAYSLAIYAGVPENAKMVGISVGVISLGSLPFVLR